MYAEKKLIRSIQFPFEGWLSNLGLSGGRLSKEMPVLPSLFVAKGQGVGNPIVPEVGRKKRNLASADNVCFRACPPAPGTNKLLY